MKAYVILKKGFEYNDEINYESDGGGGHPEKVFFKKEDAKKEILRLDIEEMKETDIEHYAYDIGDIVSDVDGFKAYIKSLNEKYGAPVGKNQWDRPDEWRLNSKATDEESIEYMRFVNLSFYDLAETEVDIPSLREAKIDQIL